MNTRGSVTITGRSSRTFTKRMFSDPPTACTDTRSTGGSAEDRLAHARKELAKRGILLVLDYVPNHVAIDHPWVSAHPEYLIAGDDQDLDEDPAAFVRLHDGVFALGRDPYFPAWTDVLQLNAFHRGCAAHPSTPSGR